MVAGVAQWWQPVHYRAWEKMVYSSKSQLSLLPHPSAIFPFPPGSPPGQLFLPVALTCFWLGLLREPWILNSDPFSSPGSVSMLRVGQGLSTVPHGAGTSDAGATSSRCAEQRLEDRSYPLFTSSSSTPCLRGLPGSSLSLKESKSSRLGMPSTHHLGQHCPGRMCSQTHVEFYIS